MLTEIQFERQNVVRRALKTLLVNPAANYLPAGLIRAILKFGKSELAAANRADPGGWRSMVISYKGNPPQLADRILVSAGTMPMALRNRRRLAGWTLAGLIDACPHKPVHVLCLGAGPGHIISDALCLAKADATATLVDLSSGAFEYGRQLAKTLGLENRVRFVLADARDIKQILTQPPNIVKMLGLCEYLTDEQIVAIVTAVAEVMPPNSSIVTNSLSEAHGTDRFFRNVFGLNMIHRSPDQLQRLLEPAGFGEFNATPEPLGVYHVLVGRRK